MTKSRAEELNPSHLCQECGVDHFYIPPVKVGDINYVPLEIIIVADGHVTFTTDQEPALSSRVPLVGMIWAIPGKSLALYKTVLVLN